MNAKLFDAMLRHGIGFNPLYFEKHTDSPNFPPHNIVEISDNHYRVTLAVAGFSQDELTISTHFSKDGPLLTITGKKGEEPVEDQTHKVLYRGIAYRNFTREFLIGENVEVVSAQLKHGLLEIDLVRNIPEAHKPKMIPILA